MALQFSDLCTVNMFDNKKVCIDEKNQVNVDFLIRDIVKMMDNPSMYLFNESATKKYFFGNVSIKSEYNGDIYSNETFLDNTYIAKSLFNLQPNSQFCIYRDNTATKLDWYDFDLIIIVEPLKSGICTEYDGIITIRDRLKEYVKLKYKSYFTKTDYFKF